MCILNAKNFQILQSICRQRLYWCTWQISENWNRIEQNVISPHINSAHVIVMSRLFLQFNDIQNASKCVCVNFRQTGIAFEWSATQNWTNLFFYFSSWIFSNEKSITIWLFPIRKMLNRRWNLLHCCSIFCEIENKQNYRRNCFWKAFYFGHSQLIASYVDRLRVDYFNLIAFQIST